MYGSALQWPARYLPKFGVRQYKLEDEQAWPASFPTIDEQVGVERCIAMCTAHVSRTAWVSAACDVAAHVLMRAQALVHPDGQPTQPTQ